MTSLNQERANGSLNVNEMMYFLDGGQQMTILNTKAMNLLPEDKKQGWMSPAASLQEARQRTLTHLDQFYALFRQHGLDPVMRKAMVRAFSLYDMGWYIRNGVHFGLFLSAITSQGTKDQQNEWLPLVLMKDIFGCFAMTELGHGSAVVAIETTATYDVKTHEFILESPTNTSTKWMIGAVGEAATHAAVYAQLVLNGEKKGVHVFIVRIRDENHHEMPNIVLGDCGPKMGLNGVDNGWLRFEKVRVPYANFLSQYARITADGKYEKDIATTSKPSTALIATRGELVMLSINMLKKALTIAIRYGAVRRQGNPGKDNVETLLLDYPSHQRRLLPLVAKAYAYHFLASYIESLIESIDQGSEDGAQRLEIIHGTMAGLKAFCTWDILCAMETCRQCCGGNGYMSINGLGDMISNFSVMVTFEGDNTVMAQQTGFYICRAYDKYCQTRNASGLYFDKALKSGQSWSAPKDIFTPEALYQLVDIYAGTKVARVYEKWSQETLDKTTPHYCQNEWIDAARVHVFHTVATRFLYNVAQLTKSGSSLAPVLTKLSTLFVLVEVELSGAFFLTEGLLNKMQLNAVSTAVTTLCKELRVDAVILVDAFNLSDAILQSCIGRYDGNIYESILSHL
ncbi:acyl-CoA dehydrogenase/oxidase [Thraustotheca clavata]|uniref:Acyl-coenzyme A oxidase n=1 Tax=Thraustotheca clavata TaxID=74557 RepID=A0A1V9Y727_9STRA|nr:acyl-CoA dehydrogenase/oxidase [Thraustotheca clavata]